MLAQPVVQPLSVEFDIHPQHLAPLVGAQPPALPGRFGVHQRPQPGQNPRTAFRSGVALPFGHGEVRVNQPVQVSAQARDVGDLSER